MAEALPRQSLAAVVSVGDELVTGQTVDTNSAWLSGQLAQLGVAVVRHVTVGDDAAATADAIAGCARLAGWVVLTGGLGPTPDDRTRQAVADLLGEPLQPRPEALAQIQERFDRMGRAMSPINRTQALAPPSAAMVRNDWGTAPGLRFALGGAECFCLPGVPAEMRSMFDASVAPAVRARLGDGPALLVRTLHTFGIGESDLAARLGELLARGRNPQIGTTASGGSVSVRIYARADRRADALAMLDDAARQVVGLLDEFYFGDDDETLESVVGRALRSAGQTLALAESCTGGLLGELVSRVPGASDYLLESIVCYSNASKVARLGVRAEDIARYGAVSEPVAAQMADGARRSSGADWAASITGVAGPGGGSADKPVGLVFIGLAGPNVAGGAGPGGVQVRRLLLPGDREFVRLRSARHALNLLRLALGGKVE